MPTETLYPIAERAVALIEAMRVEPSQSDRLVSVALSESFAAGRAAALEDTPTRRQAELVLAGIQTLQRVRGRLSHASVDDVHDVLRAALANSRPDSIDAAWAAVEALCNFAGRHIAGDSDVLPEDVYAAIEEVRALRAAHPAEAEPFAEGTTDAGLTAALRLAHPAETEPAYDPPRDSDGSELPTLGVNEPPDVAHPAEAEESHATDD